MKRNCSLLVLFIAMIFLSACADQQSEQMDYDETKKMVIDILKTDEGKKAVQEIIKDEEIQKKLILDQRAVNDTIQKTLTSEQGKDFWKGTFEDSKFAEGFAKTLRNEHEKVLKQLMKDPEYQAMLLDVLKNPQMEDEVMTVLKSQEYRKYLQEVITDTFTSPLFKTKIEETLLKAAEDLQKQQQNNQTKNEEGQ